MPSATPKKVVDKVISEYLETVDGKPRYLRDEIARRNGISAYSVHRIVKKAKVPTRTNRLPSIDRVKKIGEDSQKTFGHSWEFTLTEIAEKHGISKYSMRYFLKKAGVPTRQKQKKSQRRENVFEYLKKNLIQICEMYNAKVLNNNKIVRAYTIKQIEEKFIEAKGSINAALNFAEQKGVFVDWRHKKNIRRKQYVKNIKDIEDYLSEISEMYNSVDLNGKPSFSLLEIAEKYEVSKRTLDNALKISEQRGHQIYWRKKSNKRKL